MLSNGVPELRRALKHPALEDWIWAASMRCIGSIVGRMRQDGAAKDAHNLGQRLCIGTQQDVGLLLNHDFA